MKNFSNTCKYKDFETIAVVNKGVYTTSLIQDPFSGIRYVKKELSKEKLPIYQKLQNLKHQGLAEVIEIIEKENKLIVIIEYATGVTLKSILENKIVLDEEVAISYVQQLASILNVIHQNGIIHRDITPNNIIVAANDQVKLIDFDIARFYKNSQTEDTQLLGTPGYAAPEQFGFNQSTSSSDIYALGVLLNVMITGMKPNEMKIGNEGLATIVKNCTAMEQALRYQDVMQLDYDLRRLKYTIIEDHQKKLSNQKQNKKTALLTKVSIIMAMACLAFLGFFAFRYWQSSSGLTAEIQNTGEGEVSIPQTEQTDLSLDSSEYVSQYERDHNFESREFQENITVAQSAMSLAAPAFDRFDPAPETIFTTLASENGLGDAFMVIEGQISDWVDLGEAEITYFYITNDIGTLFIMMPHTDETFDPFFNDSFVSDFPAAGSYLRVYFQYLGFSEVLDKGGGVLIGFSEVDSSERLSDTPSEMTIVPSVLSGLAPPTDTFTSAPSAIFTTLDDEDDLNGTFMYANGYLESWRSQGGTTAFYLSTVNGMLAVVTYTPETFETNFDFSHLQVGSELQVYFIYHALSNPLGSRNGIPVKATGSIVGFTEL